MAQIDDLKAGLADASGQLDTLDSDVKVLIARPGPTDLTDVIASVGALGAKVQAIDDAVKAVPAA